MNLLIIPTKIKRFGRVGSLLVAADVARKPYKRNKRGWQVCI